MRFNVRAYVFFRMSSKNEFATLPGGLHSPFVDMMVQCFISLLLAAIAGAAGPAAPVSEVWRESDTRALIAAVETIGADGLEANSDDVLNLRDALQRGDEIGINLAATALFEDVASEMLAGRVVPQDRKGWSIEGPEADSIVISIAMQTALASGYIQEALTSLAPPHAQYQGLKAALAGLVPEDAVTRARLELNMERWRWMPRDLGAEYILINVPAFELAVIRDGVTVDRRRIIAGSARTPTPQFATTASGVIFNPTWHVPKSIAEEGIAALLASEPAEAEQLGYYTAPDGGIRQAPGDKNALGRVKLDMPNGYSIFVHDTPAKALFNRETRALSHGCIRVESALSFAQALLPQLDEAAISEIVSEGKTVTVPLGKPLPIYVTYFTAVAEEDGSVSFFPDIYGRDRDLLPAFGAPLDAFAAAPPTIEECPAAAG